jgi:hypothetical protein
MPKFPGPEKFLDFVLHYDSKNPNHRESLLLFASQVIEEQPELFSDEASWVEKYRTKPITSIPRTLLVPYFPQRDNYRDAFRTCFSSSCAMLLEFMKPGTLPGERGDDRYIQRVFSIGDTTIASVQVKALKSFGLTTSFTTTATFARLDSQLNSAIPVPIGILHKGPASAPSGGGHWIIVIGKILDEKAPGGCWYVVHDPFGELDNATGTYPITDGKGKRYSINMLRARWTVEGDGSGYAIFA